MFKGSKAIAVGATAFAAVLVPNALDDHLDLSDVCGIIGATITAVAALYLQSPNEPQDDGKPGRHEHA